MKFTFEHYIDKNGIYQGPKIWKGVGMELADPKVVSLGTLEEIESSMNFFGSQLISLGNLKKVGGFLTLRYCTKLKNLGFLEYVGSTLDIVSCTGLENIGALKTVGSLIMMDTPLLKTLKGLRKVDDLLSLSDPGLLLDHPRLKFKRLKQDSGYPYDYSGGIPWDRFTEKKEEIEKAPLAKLPKLLYEVEGVYRPFIVRRLRGAL